MTSKLFTLLGAAMLVAPLAHGQLTREHLSNASHQRAAIHPLQLQDAASEAASGAKAWRGLGYIAEEWDEDLNQWVYEDSARYTWPQGVGSMHWLTEAEWLGEDNHKYLGEHYYYHENSVWREEDRRMRTYDQDGRLTSEIFTYWSEDDQEWKTEDALHYYYDANGRMTSRTQLFLNSSGVRQSFSDSVAYYYDAQNKLVSDTLYRWETGNWAQQQATNYAYNGGGELNVQTVKAYSGGGWMDSYRYSYTYDNGKMTSEKREEWVNNAWMNSYQELTTYQNGRLHTFEYQDWDTATSAWVLDDRETFTWNGDYQQEYLYEAFEDGVLDYTERARTTEWHSEGFPTRIVWEVNENGSWMEVYRTRFYVEEYEVGNISIGSAKAMETIQLYPNPAHDQVQLNVPASASRAQVQLYDMQGRLRMQQSSLRAGLQSLDLSSLPSGQYILILTTGDAHYRASLVKR